jgi:hypothetical protein
MRCKPVVTLAFAIADLKYSSRLLWVGRFEEMRVLYEHETARVPLQHFSPGELRTCRLLRLGRCNAWLKSAGCAVFDVQLQAKRSRSLRLQRGKRQMPMPPVWLRWMQLKRLKHKQPKRGLPPRQLGNLSMPLSWLLRDGLPRSPPAPRAHLWSEVAIGFPACPRCIGES